MSDKPKRPYMPLAVKLAACLHLLGIDPDNVDISLGSYPALVYGWGWLRHFSRPQVMYFFRACAELSKKDSGLK